MATTNLCESHVEVAASSSLAGPTFDQQTAFAKAISLERFNPSLRNPDYLVLMSRRKLLSAWIDSLPREPLQVLDIGGRIQPYRPLLEGRLGTYLAIDPLATRLVDALATGEQLPFVAGSFDLVICTQVLCYCEDPFQMIREIWRVLKPDGRLLLSSPAIFPRHAENDRWRIFPAGLRLLPKDFSHVQISPEGLSIASLCRFFAVGFDQSFAGNWLHRPVNSSLVPLINRLGRRFDYLSRGSTRFTTNYSTLARK